MWGDGDDDSAAKCRERRRRRMKLRRLGSVSENGSESLGSSSRNENRTEDSDCARDGKRMRTEAETKDTPVEATVPTSSAPSGEGNKQVASEAAPSEVQAVGPVFGSMSLIGRSREMEDAIYVHSSLCFPEINRRRPVHLFAVYDGHGGSYVSSLCREKMHVIIEEELMRVSCTSGREVAGTINSTREWEELWKMAITRSFQRMDEAALDNCACRIVGCGCGRHVIGPAFCGSTAVVAILTSEHIIVANSGDSRAVLCRAGRAVPLSFDHKPDRPDELARIEAAGGRVVFVNGARVQGILAVSRAIGDKYLKPLVISDPDITFTKREAADECLILASDGMWDVLSNDLACGIASKCLREENREAAADIDLNAGPQMEGDKGAGALHPSRCEQAAALLTRLALGQESSDNISVVVVDLKRS